MSRRNTEIITNGLSSIEQQLRTNESEDDQEYDDAARKARTRRNCLIAGAVIAVVGIGATSAEWGVGWNSAYALHVEESKSVDHAGKGTVLSADMEIQPMTLSTTQTEVTGVQNSIKVDISAPIFKNLKLSYDSYGAKASALVNTEMTFAPKTIGIKYDSKSDTPLVLHVPNTGLSTKVFVDDSAEGFKYTPTESSIANNFRNAATQAAENIANAQKNLGDKNADSTKLWLVGDIASKKYTTEESLRLFTKEKIEYDVDNKCTPLVVANAGFLNAFKQNIRVAARGELLDNPSPENANNESLQKLEKLPGSELRELVNKAVIEFDGPIPDFTPDPELKEHIEQSKDEKYFYADSENPFECGISKDFTLTNVDDGGKE